MAIPISMITMLMMMRTIEPLVEVFSTDSLGARGFALPGGSPGIEKKWQRAAAKSFYICCLSELMIRFVQVIPNIIDDYFRSYSQIIITSTREWKRFPGYD